MSFSIGYKGDNSGKYRPQVAFKAIVETGTIIRGKAL
jgi:hypothetical protein